jgi:hypothetical protein
MPAPLLDVLDDVLLLLLDDVLLLDVLEEPLLLDDVLEALELLEDDEELLLLVVPPTHVPAWQVPVVWQGVPSGARGWSQALVAGSQVPATWHSSRGGQARGAQVPSAGAPAQVWQTSQGLSQAVSQQTGPCTGGWPSFGQATQWPLRHAASAGQPPPFSAWQMPAWHSPHTPALDQSGPGTAQSWPIAGYGELSQTQMLKPFRQPRRPWNEMP